MAGGVAMSETDTLVRAVLQVLPQLSEHAMAYERLKGLFGVVGGLILLATAGILYRWWSRAHEKAYMHDDLPCLIPILMGIVVALGLVFVGVFLPIALHPMGSMVVRGLTR